jgi:hypothetical protein
MKAKILCVLLGVTVTYGVEEYRASRVRKEIRAFVNTESNTTKTLAKFTRDICPHIDDQRVKLDCLIVAQRSRRSCGKDDLEVEGNGESPVFTIYAIPK